jgi:hypothetical protein
VWLLHSGVCFCHLKKMWRLVFLPKFRICAKANKKGEVRTHYTPDTLVTFNSLPVVALSPLKGLCEVHDGLSLLPSFVQFNDTALCNHYK